MTTEQLTSGLLLLAGVGQIGLAIGSLWIPKALRWPAQLKNVEPLTRQVFWTYAAYILVSHLCFGVLAIFGRHWLVDGSPLAACVCAFIAVWWLARIVLQFTAFDRSAAPEGTFYKLAEAVLVAAFVFFGGVHSFAAWLNLQ